jgi:hypothetical protein
MSHLRSRSRRMGSFVLAAGLVLALGCGLASNTGASFRGTQESSSYRLAAEVDDAVVLPARVANAIARTENALDRAGAAIDDDLRTAAIKSLRAVIKNIRRAQSVGMRQMNAPPATEDAETTPGPDSVVAVLGMEQEAVIRLTSYFDDLTRPRVIARLRAATTVAYNNRARMLDAVTKLDPEGAGADYADGMADTVDAYADEVSAVSDALAHDRLTATARIALTRDIQRSQAAQTVVTAAFGGGE